MARKEIEEEDYREIRDEESEESDYWKNNMREKIDNAKEELRIYTDKAKDNIQNKPFESVLIATGIGTLVGISMAASAIGMAKMHSNNNPRSRFSKVRKDINDWHSFEDDVKNNPLQSLGIAIGVGILLGALMGKKDGNK